MRTKPEPGNYTMTIHGLTFHGTITAEGATAQVGWMTYELTWIDLPPGGPVLAGEGVIVGFQAPDQVAIVDPQGRSQTGTYAKV